MPVRGRGPPWPQNRRCARPQAALTHAYCRWQRPTGIRRPRMISAAVHVPWGPPHAAAVAQESTKESAHCADDVPLLSYVPAPPAGRTPLTAPTAKRLNPHASRHAWLLPLSVQRPPGMPRGTTITSGLEGYLEGLLRRCRLSSQSAAARARVHAC